MLKLNQVIGVIRTHNNSAIVKQVKTLRSFLPRVIVMVDAQKDMGATPAWMKEVGDRCVLVDEMASGYTWSNALNRALHHVAHLNARREQPYQFVFNVSNEALFKREDVSAMLAEFSDELVGAVGTSFQGIQEGNEVLLGRSYRHPRNTGMLIRLSVFEKPMLQLGFDPFCDDIGGMEDVDFIYRMLVFSEMKTVMLDRKVPLIVGRNYNQPQKEAHEREAMEKIFARYQQWSERLTSSVIGAWRLLAD